MSSGEPGSVAAICSFQEIANQIHMTSILATILLAQDALNRDERKSVQYTLVKKKAQTCHSVPAFASGQSGQV